MDHPAGLGPEVSVGPAVGDGQQGPEGAEAEDSIVSNNGGTHVDMLEEVDTYTSTGGTDREPAHSSRPIMASCSTGAPLGIMHTLLRDYTKQRVRR